MNLLFRLFLAFNSTAFIIVVFLIKEGVTIPFVPKTLLYRNFQPPNYYSYLIYFVLVFFLTYVGVQVSKFLDSDNLATGSIKNIEYANDSFLPSYLGYFFVALSAPNIETFIFVYALVFVFTFYSQVIYFNPAFLLFGYHFYYLTTGNDVKIFLITKRTFKNIESLSLPSLKRINNFTFIEH